LKISGPFFTVVKSLKERSFPQLENSSKHLMHHRFAHKWINPLPIRKPSVPKNAALASTNLQKTNKVPCR